MTKLRAVFHSFANALQKVGIYIKIRAAAMPAQVFLHLRREFKNVNPILTEKIT
jgi:hypothetical protein